MTPTPPPSPAPSPPADRPTPAPAADVRLRGFARFRARVSALLVVYYAHMLEFRAELFLWALANSLPFIMMGAWAVAGGSGAFALSRADFVRYFLAVFIVRQLTVVWVIWDFEHDVVEGKLSARLLQPMDPVWRYVAAHVAERGARVPFSAAIVAVVLALAPDARWAPAASDLARFAVAILLAFTLRFVIQYTLAMLAFWAERAASVQDLWFLGDMFLSGVIAPLDVYPAGFREIALWTPFPYTISVPANLLVGRPVDLAAAGLTFTLWLVVFAILQRVLWRAGLRRYSAMGA